MKKLFVSALLATIGFSALAQTAYGTYKFEDSTWNIGGRFAIGYNYVTNVPDHMSHSGLGLDFCIMEGQYFITPNSILSLGLLDLQIDFRYLQKGYIFSPVEYYPDYGHASGTNLPDGNIAGIHQASQDSRAKGHMTDFTFSFPFGFTQKFSSRLAASVYVAPGVGLIRYNSDYISGDVHYKNGYYPNKNRAGFRLDLKAILWFEDLGLVVRYQPVGFTIADGGHKSNTFSVGLAFCY
ncbi:MAG: hypothetical protein J5646_02160 [Bacteroidales bacterium]|nr:hypothetical protein [Bacteroidales bacterium]